MAKASRKARITATPQVSDAEIPVVGPREPCPCGSAKRYKVCHGRLAKAAALATVARPFEGIAAETDLVAMRQLIPAASAETKTTAAYGAKEVVLASILPGAMPAMHRSDGVVLVSMQAATPGGDVSRGLGAALAQALSVEAGTAITQIRLEPDSPRLQDLLESDFTVTVHDDFNFWLDPSQQLDGEAKKSLDQANESIAPTVAVKAVESAYWVDAGVREHLRWVTSFSEDDLLTGLARLAAGGQETLSEGTKFAGYFRADGLVVPVWDLPSGFGAAGCEAPLAALYARLTQAIAATEPLTAEQRRHRSEIVSRQVTLR
ncbi:SEC-C domain-containing protein [Micrococcales bacterium 31B]|nr:SEC-C domain-containing protein [Micrococcales bacterium 31B]